MRLRHLTEDERKKMGRDLNHVEDLVIFYGSDGAREALEILRDLTSGQHDLSIKWDGKVALYYGRDENGDFGMGTKGNWAKNNPMRSAQAAHEYITTAGKGEDWRQVMGQDFIKIFPLLEASVPVGFRGFVTGDLLYSPALAPKQKTSKGIEFTPNQVTYIANSSSEIGRRIDSTTMGIALHMRFDGWNSTNSAVIGEDTVRQLNTNAVLALGQTYAPHPPKLDDSVLRELESMVARQGRTVDAVIEKRPGLSDIPNILYTFSNQMVRAGRPADVANFVKWLPDSGVSTGKQAKIASINEEIPNGFATALGLHSAMANAKNEIIDQLDSAQTDIRAITKGQPGGEGYVSLKHKVKLVPRHRWRPS
jgi:hypothetical protein